MYTIVFIIGTFFGSFFSLAIYRIPRKEDILIKHSYCPNCNKRLGFFDLFPVFSYIFLKGRCRCCKEKIKSRYLILELLSGFIFLVIVLSLKININNIFNIKVLLNLSVLLIYVSILFIIAGIDKENIDISKSVIVVGYIVEMIYIIYQCTLNNNINVYQYVMYIIYLMMILILSNITLKLLAKEKYFIKALFLVLYMVIFGGSHIFILTTILALILISVYSSKYREENRQIPIGFCLCISNIFIIIASNILINYVL